MEAQGKKYPEGSKPANSGFNHSALNNRLNIGFDGKRATNNTTGLGNYSRSLIEDLAKTFNMHRYFVYTPKLNKQIAQFSLFKSKNVYVRLPTGFFRKFLWRSLRIKQELKADKIDIFHGLSNEIPIGLKKEGIKSAVTIHDLIFLKRPQDYQFINRFIYRLKSQYACRNADKIIAVSEQTKADIIEHYQIEPNKIEVIYQTCDEIFKQVASAHKKNEVSKKYQLPKKYILSVGTIEPRKNLLLIVKAMTQTTSNFSLVVIGKAKSYFKEVEKEINRENLQQRIIFLKHVSFEDLPSVYQLANLFVYPSFYEGFGIPIIEALFSKAPVIAAKGSCLEEAGGSDSLYINPEDYHDLAKKIDLILTSPDMANNMIERGYRYVQKFKNDQISKQLVRCYLQILNK